MTCDDFLRRLDEGDEGADLDAHRAGCASCETLHRESLALDAAIRALPLPEPDWDAYDLQLRKKLHPAPRRFWIAWTAAAAAMVAASLYTMNPAKTPAPSFPPVAASPKPEAASPLTRFSVAFGDYVKADAKDREALEPELLALGRGLASHVATLAGSSDRAQASAALALVGKLRAPETIPVLKEHLDGNAWRNGAVLATIARMNLPGSAAAIAEAMTKPELREAAAEACVELPPSRAVPILVASYADLGAASQAAADKVIAANPAEARRAVASALAGPRADSYLLLGARLDLKEAAPGIIRMIKAWPMEWRDAADALARISDASALRALLGSESAAAFAKAKGDAGAEELRRLALDRDPAVAVAAVEVLPRFDDAKTRRTLARAAGRPGSRDAAIAALVELEDDRTLATLLASPDLLRGDVAAVLGRAKSAQLRPALVRAALNPATSLQTAETLLDGYAPAEIAPSLIPALGDYHSRARAGELLRRLTGLNLPSNADAWTHWLQKENKP